MIFVKGIIPRYLLKGKCHDICERNNVMKFFKEPMS